MVSRGGVGLCTGVLHCPAGFLQLTTVSASATVESPGVPAIGHQLSSLLRVQHRHRWKTAQSHHPRQVQDRLGMRLGASGSLHQRSDAVVDSAVVLVDAALVHVEPTQSRPLGTRERLTVRLERVDLLLTFASSRDRPPQQRAAPSRRRSAGGVWRLRGAAFAAATLLLRPLVSALRHVDSPAADRSDLRRGVLPRTPRQGQPRRRSMTWPRWAWTGQLEARQVCSSRSP